MGRRKGEMKRCGLCGGFKRRCYVEVFRNGKHTYLAVGWLCPRCETFSCETERYVLLSHNPKRKPKKRCSCGSPMLRLYVKEPKTQKLIAIGWLCLSDFSHTSNTLDFSHLKAENA
ncbi:MAG: hypothetical protein ACXQS5_04215 [Candidatus Methanospirareceae archaeon]